MSRPGVSGVCGVVHSSALKTLRVLAANDETYPSRNNARNYGTATETCTKRDFGKTKTIVVSGKLLWLQIEMMK